MEGSEILAQAVRRAKYASDTPRQVVPVPGLVALQDRVQFLEGQIGQLASQIRKIEIERIAAARSKREPVFEVGEARRVTVEDIKRVICLHYNISEAELSGPCKTAGIVKARQIACYLCARHTYNSLPNIGRRFGGRDHSTIVHARDKIKYYLHTGCAETIAEVSALEKLLGISKNVEPQQA